MKSLALAILALSLAAPPAMAQLGVLGEAPWLDPDQPRTWLTQPEPKTINILSPIATSSKVAVKNAYNLYYAPAMPAMGWTGSVAGCNAGTISTAFKEWTISRVNYFRAMAGLPGNITLDAAGSVGAQQAALVYTANSTFTPFFFYLSHVITADKLCYTAAAATAASTSNISLGYGSSGFDDVVPRYIDDGGQDVLGHRRWILYPPQTMMGVGSTPGGPSAFGANALVVFNGWGSRPATPNGVAWPNSGYVPMQVLPPGNIWSWSFNGADFSAANVTMTANGSGISVAMGTAGGFSGYGDNTVSWTVGPAIVKDTVYVVNITGITGAGAPASYSYTVRPFDPADPIGGATMDFNNDGKSDLLWKNTADGSTQGWLMNGLAATQIAGLLPAGGYSVTHTADLDGDGKADLLIRHTDGTVIAWLMNGLSVPGNAVILPAGSGWSVMKTGDLNGDGKADLILQHTDGTVVAWIMNGLSVSSVGTFVSAGSGWSVAKVADLNGDGKSDLIWQHTDGRVQAWLMDGTIATQVATFVGAGSGWSVARTGDFDGDGKTDLLWQHTDGRTQAWIMNGLTVTGLATFTPAGTGWTPVHAGDINGDGKDDLFWEHTSGASQTWLMNGTAVTGLATFVPAGTGWTASHLFDLNGDGRKDVMWKHTTGAVQAWLMNGLTITQLASLAPAGTYQVTPAAP